MTSSLWTWPESGTKRLQQANKLQNCYKNITTRDYIDSHRAFCPLEPAKDSIEINTTEMTIDEVVDAILVEAKKKGIN